jgi:signal recognition particle GTPase
MQAGNFFSKFARTIVEKARADVERTKRLFQGLELIRSDMSVIDELLSFWNLEDADTTLEKLEEALITRDFGVATASRLCDALREDVKSGIIRDPRLATEANHQKAQTRKRERKRAVTHRVQMEWIIS